MHMSPISANAAGTGGGVLEIENPSPTHTGKVWTECDIDNGITLRGMAAVLIMLQVRHHSPDRSTACHPTNGCVVVIGRGPWLCPS